MSIDNTLALLSNFSHATNADQLAYELFEQRLHIPEYRRRVREIVEDMPPETDPQGTDREAALERERRQLSRMLVEAELEKAELELLVFALDLKLSLVAQHVHEPFPGFFAQIGITPRHGLQRPQPRRDPPHLRLVKTRLSSS